MALFRQNRNLKQETNTGFGVNSANSAGRFYDRDSGRANVIKRGVNILDRYSWYHTLLAMPRGKFILLLFVIYIVVNLAFAGIYCAIGIKHLAGINKNPGLSSFADVFFFSTQTFTTVGYGRISPVGFLTSFVATFEAFIGLLSFALATGLFYGRFSRPRAFLRFSHNAIIAPYENGIALMFRMAPYKNNNLSEVETKVTLAMQVEEDGKRVNRFYDLELEMTLINALALSWTIVHPINEKSPLYNFSYKDMVEANIEVFPYVKAFDQVFSNTVMTRYSYVASEVIWGAKFKMMYHPNHDKTKTILEVSHINDFEKVVLPESILVS